MEDHPENLPILDTGATHCLLPISWLGAEDCEKAKRIHLKVATGTTVRALLYNNAIYPVPSSVWVNSKACLT